MMLSRDLSPAGLKQAHGAAVANPAGCARACCAAPSCTLWLYGDASLPPTVANSCWLGASTCRGALAPGWNGASSLPIPAPAPTPPAPGPPPPTPHGIPDFGPNFNASKADNMNGECNLKTLLCHRFATPPTLHTTTATTTFSKPRKSHTTLTRSLAIALLVPPRSFVADVFSQTPGAKGMEELFPKRFADYP